MTSERRFESDEDIRTVMCQTAANLAQETVGAVSSELVRGPWTLAIETIFRTSAERAFDTAMQSDKIRQRLDKYPGEELHFCRVARPAFVQTFVVCSREYWDAMCEARAAEQQAATPSRKNPSASG